MGNKIKEVFRTLTIEQQEMLKLAHDHGVTQYIKLAGNLFIGVHCQGIPALKIDEVYNDWYIGRVFKGE